MGLIANATQLHATGFIALHPRPGNVAIVSQSGNLGVQLSALADRRDLGVRCFVGVGNEAQVSAVDVLEYLKDDDGTSCVLAYLEGIDDGRRLFDVAARDQPQEAGRRAARRPHRRRRQGRRVAHRRHGRVGGGLRGRRPADRSRHLHVRAGGAGPHHGPGEPAAPRGAAASPW